MKLVEPPRVNSKGPKISFRLVRRKMELQWRLNNKRRRSTWLMLERRILGEAWRSGRVSLSAIHWIIVSSEFYAYEA